MVVQNTNNSSVICGLPFFCKPSALETCYNTTLIECQECTVGNGAVYIVFCLLLGLFILVGNVLVVIIMAKYAKKSKGNTVKISLAIADILTAIQLLVIIPSNFSWTINSSLERIEYLIEASKNSAEASTGGILYLLGLIASVYHLVYLSGLRLYSVQSPLRYKLFTDLRFKIGLFFVWLLAILSSTAPVFFSDVLTFTYFPSIFSYFWTPVQDSNDRSNGAAIAIIFSFTIVPYVLMVSLTILTIIYYYKQQAKSRVLRGTTPNHRSQQNSYAIKLLVTMEVGFSITLAPLIVYEGLLLSGYFSCNDIPIPSAVVFGLSSANGLVNFIVYSAWDLDFQGVFRSVLSKETKSYTPSTQPNTPLSNIS